MSTKYGENSKPDGNSKAYVNNDKFWDNLAAEKKRKEKAIEVREHHQEEAKVGQL